MYDESLSSEAKFLPIALLPTSVMCCLSLGIAVSENVHKAHTAMGYQSFRVHLSSDQLILLLESLLDQKTLNPQTLRSLQRTYRLHEQDAEVRHRWCELIVKHKYTKAYAHVERFLQEDQAMGVYLYGELMVGEDARQQQLARRCFMLVKEQMDRASAQVVAEMLF